MSVHETTVDRKNSLLLMIIKNYSSNKCMEQFLCIALRQDVPDFNNITKVKPVLYASQRTDSGQK